MYAAPVDRQTIRLGPFELLEPIGSGGMGVVWAGVHGTGQPEGGQLEVAVKVIAGEFAWTERFRRAFRTEVRAVAALDHPGIISVLDAGEISPEAAIASQGRLVARSPYLVTERMCDGTLSSWLSSPPSWATIRTAALGLLDALGHAHARGVIHRDVKPGNILLDLHGRPRLGDFGIAQLLDGEGTIEDLGTPAYMAPEQFVRANEWIGPWTDLYAFGCTLWAVVTGQPPWGDRRGTALRNCHLYAARPALRPAIAVPSGLEQVLHRAMAASPNSRYQRAAEFVLELEALGGADRIGVSAGSRPEPVSERTPPAARTTGGLAGSKLAVPHSPRAAPVLVEPPSDPPSEPDISTRALRGAGIGLYGIRTPPLVGRKAERKVAWSTLVQAARGEGPRVLLLRGITGTGKTRLATWLTEHAHAACAAEVWVGRHGPTDGGIGTLLQSWLGPRSVWNQDQLPAVRARLSALPADPADPEDSALAEETVLADIALPQGRVRFTQPSERYAAVGSVIRRIARERLMVLRIEDLQWGADALSLVKYLLAEGPPRLLVVGTIRDEVLAERPIELPLVRDLVADERVTVVNVGPLPRVDRQHLVQALLPLEPSLAVRIAERTAGSPLLAVQLVGDLVARGVLDADEVGFRLRGEVLPSVDLADVWTQRLEALLAGAHGSVGLSLELAATLGLSVDVEEWGHALQLAQTQESEGEVAPAQERELGGEVLGMSRQLAERLVSSGLARAEDDPHRGFTFVHPMLRDVLLARAERAGRAQKWHELCARSLAERRGAEIAQRRARHLLEAGRPLAAASTWLEVARERVSTGEYDAATDVLGWWETSMTESAPIHDPAWGQGWCVQFSLAYQRGDLDTAAQWAQRVVDHARWHGWMELECRGLIDLAGVRVAMGRRDEADKLLARASELPISSEPGLRARLDLTMGMSWGAGGDHQRALAALARARAGFEAQGALVDAGSAARFEAVAALGACDPHRAVEAAQRARDWLAAVGHRPGVAAADNALGEAYRATGDLAAAERFYQSARDGMRRLGMAKAVIPEANLSIVLIEQGRVPQATALLQSIASSAACRARPTLHVAVQMMLLATAAMSRDWPRFDQLLDGAGPLVARAGLVEPDAVRALQRAVQAAREAGQGARADRLEALRGS
jgi:serine/threonine protein kinase/tetratricopeptide (TPR) repeat protein